MGVVVFVAGKSGAGKSYSLRNFNPEDVAVFNILGKPLPFRKHLRTALTPTYKQIGASIQQGQYPAYVIDDSTYLMANENFERVYEKGYDKFAQMAKNFRDLIMAAISAPPHVVTYFMHHVEPDGMGGYKLKTVGRMLDEKFCIEGATSVFIDAAVDADGNHVFYTTAEGPSGLAKCPPEMLPAVMDNDLAAVDAAIRDYWQLNKEEEQA